MEIHHHPHVAKKNFKEYFLEFLMIFLAVTMGFIAENIREHFAEQKTVHQYLSNYRQELLRNQKNIADDKELIKNQLPVLDSFVTIFNTETENKDLQLTARLFDQCIYDYNPNLETAVYQQMVNSGGLKLIDNDSLKNYLARYIDKIEEFKIFNQKLSGVIFNRFPDVARHMDIYNLLKENFSDVKPFPDLTLGDRREIIILFMNQYEELLNANSALNEIDSLNSKLLQIINE